MEESSGIILFRREGMRQSGKEGSSCRFLLLRYTAGHWDFPKGHVEEGETDTEAALRETKEETGIGKVILMEGFREKLDYFYKRDGRVVYKEVSYFLGEAEEKRVKLSFEHTDFEWLDYDDAMTRLTYRNSREVLVKAAKYLQIKD